MEKALAGQRGVDGLGQEPFRRLPRTIGQEGAKDGHRQPLLAVEGEQTRRGLGLGLRVGRHGTGGLILAKGRLAVSVLLAGSEVDEAFDAPTQGPRAPGPARRRGSRPGGSSFGKAPPRHVREGGRMPDDMGTRHIHDGAQRGRVREIAFDRRRPGRPGRSPRHAWFHTVSRPDQDAERKLAPLSGGAQSQEPRNPVAPVTRTLLPARAPRFPEVRRHRGSRGDPRPRTWR